MRLTYEVETFQAQGLRLTIIDKYYWCDKNRVSLEVIK